MQFGPTPPAASPRYRRRTTATRPPPVSAHHARAGRLAGRDGGRVQADRVQVLASDPRLHRIEAVG